MRSILEKRLDLILETDVTQVADDPYQIAMGLTTDLEEARRKVTDLERQLMYAMDRLCGGLAVGIRKQQPGLNIGLNNGMCNVGYKTKHLSMKPDIGKRVWAVDSTDPSFARRFVRKHGPHTSLTNDLTGIAQAIADFFTGHYRSLGEDITNTGKILLDGRSARIDDIICRIQHCDRLLCM